MKRILLLLALLALARPAAAQVVAAQGSPGPVTAPWKFSLVVGGAVVDPRDMSDRSGRLVGAVTFVSAQPVTQSGPWSFSCSSGCGSPPAVPDSSAFAFGTINVGPGADVVDDVATNTVAENSFGTPRMSASRIRLMAVTDDTGTRIVVATAGGQTTGNASLSSIDGKTPALVSGREPVDPSGVTSPVSVASLPLPTGAATSALQPTLVAGRTPVDPSGVTSPVSVASLPLPTGAATSALQPTLVGGRTPVDPSGVTSPISAASLPLPAGAATSALQTTTDTDINSLLKPASTLAAVTTVTNVTTLGSITNAIPLPTLTKSTQGATGASIQQLHDAGRNTRNFIFDTRTAAPLVEALESVTQWYSNATVATTTTPAVIPAGKILRLTSWKISYQSLATVGYCVVRVRFNTAGVAVLASPVVFSFEAGSNSGATTAAVTGAVTTLNGDFPEGLELPAAGGLGFSMAGYGPTGTLTLEGGVRFEVYGYEY